MVIEHAGSGPRPFGLSEQAVRECYERALTSPEGMDKVEAFAFCLEAAAVEDFGAFNLAVLPIVRDYGRLKLHAENMAQAILTGDASDCSRALSLYKLDAVIPEYRSADED